MALRTPPSWLQNGSHPAENDRLTTQALWASTGIIGTGSLAVSPNSPAGMSVRVASGWAAIIGTTQSNMGAYVIFNDAIDTLTVTTADPTLPRIDRVVATVRDAYYSGAFNDVIFQIIAGTPAASPSAPAIPANSISLATISVGAAVTQINAGNITDTRVDTTTNLPIGDITNITAGTGLSGGGASGAVTLSIDTATTVDISTAQTLTNKTLTSPKINLGLNAQTGTTYTPVADDNGKLVTLSNGSPIIVTIPTNASVPYPTGAQITFARIGAGQVTIQGDTGVTILSTGATATAPILRVTASTATAIKTGTDNWLVVGDII